MLSCLVILLLVGFSPEDAGFGEISQCAFRRDSYESVSKSAHVVIQCCAQQNGDVIKKRLSADDVTMEWWCHNGVLTTTKESGWCRLPYVRESTAVRPLGPGKRGLLLISKQGERLQGFPTNPHSCISAHEALLPHTVPCKWTLLLPQPTTCRVEEMPHQLPPSTHTRRRKSTHTHANARAHTQSLYHKST